MNPTMRRCLAALCALALPLAAEMSADDAKAKVKEAGQAFRGMMAASDKGKKQELYGTMDAALTAVAKEEKQDGAAASQADAEAGAIDSAEHRALWYFFVCDAYCHVERWQPALGWINKALGLSKNDKYAAKKKEIEEKLK